MWREITACSESQELIVTLCILLEYEETACTTRTNSSYMCGKLQMMLLVLDVVI